MAKKTDRMETVFELSPVRRRYEEAKRQIRGHGIVVLLSFVVGCGSGAYGVLAHGSVFGMAAADFGVRLINAEARGLNYDMVLSNNVLAATFPTKKIEKAKKKP